MFSVFFVQKMSNFQLIRGVSPSKKSSGSGKRSGGVPDSTGSASGTANTEDIQMDDLEDGNLKFDNFGLCNDFKKSFIFLIFIQFLLV